VVVEIRRSACHDIDAAAHEGGPNAKWSSKQYRTRVTSNMTALVDHIHGEKPDARVVFLHTNLCESVSAVPRTLLPLLTLRRTPRPV
jgi:hypothetical protein